MWHSRLPVASAESCSPFEISPPVVDEELLAGGDVHSDDEGHCEAVAVHDSLGYYVVSDAVVVDESVQDAAEDDLVCEGMVRGHRKWERGIPRPVAINIRGRQANAGDAECVLIVWVVVVEWF